MGKRISVDSATLMNKGLEVIEAMWLFDLRLSQVEIIIHPEAIIHSMIELIDGVVLAQLAIADMRIPIQYALNYPSRFRSSSKALDFFKLKNLSFQKPNLNKFPCLKLAFEAARESGSMPCVLNAADEVAVGSFLNKRLDFTDIPKIVAKVMRVHKKVIQPSLPQILDIDAWARAKALELIKNSR